MPIGDMYTPEEGESEPEWVQTEKKHFTDLRDANKVWGWIYRQRLIYIYKIVCIKK